MGPGTLKVLLPLERSWSRRQSRLYPRLGEDGHVVPPGRQGASGSWRSPGRTVSLAPPQRPCRLKDGGSEAAEPAQGPAARKLGAGLRTRTPGRKAGPPDGQLFSALTLPVRRAGSPSPCTMAMTLPERACGRPGCDPSPPTSCCVLGPTPQLLWLLFSFRRQWEPE